ncbi:MAG: hypothetical protein ACRD3O_03600 [Terriglobia bacterium]
MRILALIIVVYTPAMLLIHLSTGKILKAWKEQPNSWINRQFSPQRALRIEALFWLLTLAAWTLWQPLAWKVIVALFAAIHLGIWSAGELTTNRNNGVALTQAGYMRRVIVVFDLVEAFVLAAVGVIAVLYLIHAG